MRREGRGEEKRKRKIFIPFGKLVFNGAARARARAVNSFGPSDQGTRKEREGKGRRRTAEFREEEEEEAANDRERGREGGREGH